MCVNLQKSQWGEQFYINLGIFLKALGNAKSPKENECHIRVRLSSLAEAREHLDSALDVESELTDEERTQVIGTAVRNTALPFLGDRSTLGGIRIFLARAQSKKLMIDKAVKDLVT